MKNQNELIFVVFIINKAVWNNPLIFLTHQLFEITPFGVDVLLTEKPGLHKQKLKTVPQRNLRKDAGPFIKTFFFYRCLCHIFAIGNQLAGFSTCRLASVEDIFNVYIIFKCKYICKYEPLFIKIYLSSIFRKILFLLPHLLCNVEFEFS